MSTRCVRVSEDLDAGYLADHARPYRGRVIRMVEAQHRIATNRLADDGEAQALLDRFRLDAPPGGG